MQGVPGIVRGEGRMHVLVYVGFVTQCFGNNISMGLCVVGCGFPGVYFLGGGFVVRPLLIGSVCLICATTM